MTPREALRSRSGGRLAHAPLFRADASQPGEAARRGAAGARHPPVGVLPSRVATAYDPDHTALARDERSPAPLSRRARRSRRTDLRDAEVPDAQARRGGPAWAVSRGGARAPHTVGDDEGRQVAAEDAARRGPAALERPERRHEPCRPEADQASLLRGARGRAAGLLAAARGAPRLDRLCADPTRLRDVDGREARARPGVDRRSFGAALPADTVDDGHPGR